MKKPSDAQLLMVAHIANVLAFRPEEINKAFASVQGAYRFIEQNKPKMDEQRQAEADERAAGELYDEPDENRLFLDVENGRCPDHVAEARGQCIAEFVGIKPVKDRFITPYGTKTGAGLYRSLIRYIIENQVEWMED